MSIDLFEKIRKGFSGATGIADAADIETTGQSNAQADLDSRIDGVARNGDNLRFTRGDGTTFDVGILDGGNEPVFTSFTLGDQGTEVDAPFTFSGTQQYSYTLDNSTNIGLLTVTRELVSIESNITPQAAGSGFALIPPGNPTVLQAGDSVTFRIRGTSTLSGNPLVERTYVVTARNPQDFIYLSAETDNDPSDVDTNAATRVAFQSGNQVVTVPTFTGNRYLTILQRASDPNLTQLLIGGINQLPAFTKTDDAITINSVVFDAYVSTNLLIGSAVSGQQMTLVRS